MTCKECLQTIRSLPDDTPLKIPAEARAHLDECTRCRARMAALLLLEEGTGLRAEAPAGLVESIMQKTEKTERTLRPVAQSSPRARILRLVPLAAAAAAVLVLGSLMVSHLVREPDVARQTAKVALTLEAPAAAEVAVVGDWNDWNPRAQLMTRHDGKWEIVLQLTRGRSYQYQFLIDGKTWIADPNNLVRVDNGFGGMNSLIGS